MTMEWLFGAALLPLVLCGAMCVGGAVLAAIGLRRSTHDHRAGEPIPPAPSDPSLSVTTSVRHRLCEPAAPR
jgi:hypothetical protein